MCSCMGALTYLFLARSWITRCVSSPSPVPPLPPSLPPSPRRTTTGSGRGLALTPTDPGRSSTAARRNDRARPGEVIDDGGSTGGREAPALAIPGRYGAGSGDPKPRRSHGAHEGLGAEPARGHCGAGAGPERGLSGPQTRPQRPEPAPQALTCSLEVIDSCVGRAGPPCLNTE